MSPDAFLALYNRISGPFMRPGTRPRSSTPSTRREVAQFLEWCRRETVDPERWLRARTEAANVRIAVSKLATNGRFLEQFRSWGDDRQAVITREETAVVVADTDPVRELTVLGEAMKAALSAEPEVCSWSTEAGGWHPASKWCVACPAAEPCKTRLSPLAKAVRLARC